MPGLCPQRVGSEDRPCVTGFFGPHEAREESTRSLNERSLPDRRWGSCRRPSGTMNDEPYRPSFTDEEDSQEVMRTTGARPHHRRDSGRVPDWHPPQGREGRSLLSPAGEDLAGLVSSAERKLESGRSLSVREGRVLAYRAALRLLGSRRPAAVAAGAQILAKLDQQRAREREERRTKSEKKRQRKQWLHGLALPR